MASFSTSPRIPRYLRVEQDRIEKVGAEFGLDFLPVIFEMVTYDQMNEIAAYGGFPNRYPHWRFGMEYERLAKSSEYGLSKIYELVINNNPSVAYLLEGNSLTDQKLVMCHVLGHVDFFKNNFMFRSTDLDSTGKVVDMSRKGGAGYDPNRKWIDKMANHFELHLALAHLGEAALEAVQRRLGGGDLRLRGRDPLLLLGRFLIGDALAVPKLLEPLGRRLGLAGLVGLDGGELLLELLLLDDQPDDGLLELGLLGRSGGAALVEVLHPVLAATDLGLVRSDLVVGGEGGVLSLLGALFDRRRLQPRDLELGLARAERDLRGLLLLEVHGAPGVLDLGQRDDLEQFVRRLVEDQILELGLVGDVALGLGGLALEATPGFAGSRSRCRRREAGSAASDPS